ncbi:shikimate dehydrogenase [Clostridium sp. LP20]|uniref:shikimate dehydrogenase n=1 Tax=Clostridium sp. LP20 TaxID=3418665 RepID=UPI003EE5CA47
MDFYGVVGEKLSHSLSPRINNRLFELLGIEAAYKSFEIPKNDISKLGDSLKLLGIKGVNVTIPYKQEVLKDLDFIAPEAKAIGAVNTILLKDSKLYGYNSDYYGFGSMLKNSNIEVKGNIAVVLGAGGAAKAVMAYLFDEGVKEIYLVSRDKTSNVDVDNRAIRIDYDDLKNISGDILVNTTPVGMYPNVGKSPVSEEVIDKFKALIDLIYNPQWTEFLRIGKSFGKKTCGGLYMLVGQAIKSQEIWQNQDIGKGVLNKIYEELEKEFS